MAYKPVVIDIYAGNDLHSMKGLKEAGIIGIVHKATQGVSVKDKRYAERRIWAKKEGPELWGAYHFNSETSSIRQQAIEFVNHAQPDEFTMLAADWEGDSPSVYWSAKDAREWLMRVMDLTKREPSGIWIYGGNIPRQLITNDADAEFFGQFHNWHCQYGTDNPKVSKAWKNGYELWQYSEKGQLLDANGNAVTGGAVDLNVYKGSIDELRAKWAPGYRQGFVKPAPIVPSKPPTGVSPVQPVPPVPAVPNVGKTIKDGAKSFWSWFKTH